MQKASRRHGGLRFIIRGAAASLFIMAFSSGSSTTLARVMGDLEVGPYNLGRIAEEICCRRILLPTLSQYV